ncbi:1a95266e-0392-432b-a694-7b0a1278e126-CDS [Sclerotinia trifoliorum]|uniref:1a95266e-0392-432b-a694-7b0a1278e126-CDS n=1 Tax=Sclerotinia trifoliorum TaxID=28548 RepID=A0A8H2VWJ7_9HELO|nr:1a95266e-0392-432b-a694-7b0a1278e126-CDS [Sclerotinia trifoliorum]
MIQIDTNTSNVNTINKEQHPLQVKISQAKQSFDRFIPDISTNSHAFRNRPPLSLLQIRKKSRGKNSQYHIRIQQTPRHSQSQRFNAHRERADGAEKALKSALDS